jgi:hypothetical protein
LLKNDLLIINLQARLNAIADLARRYNHAGCNADLHAAMNRVLELATGEKREYR